ncbi:MAG: hypothetical protein JW784_01405, partial [Candidatus Cloacimonetes bacterium]|nr:hypothetical protein [Candidatus Cloacimonadota bacterium]
MYLIKNVRAPLVPEPDLAGSLAEKFGIERAMIGRILIRRRSLDARKKNQIGYNFTLLADLPVLAHPDLLPWQEEKPDLEPVHQIHDPHPFIVGTGPAGLFCALGLVEKGYRPWLFDRGDSLPRRQEKVNDFWRKGNLDPESNVQFGEGGAGTFSDGKLTARNRDFYSEKIFDYLVEFGADPDIRIDALPHLGSDGIRLIVSRLRAYLEQKGCRFFWNHCLNGIEISHNRISSILINQTAYKPEILILAVGNAARDTFVLLSRQIRLDNKPFAVGVRIEHSQDFLNRALYGEKTNLQLTGPATYRLTSQCQGRGVYSFCMCPGGYVIAASSEAEHLVLNGMSFSSRSHSLANSA